jgi:uncharacterized protein involved in exopolysaccharide biosynthesis
VQVFQEEELNREVRISQENTVTLPLIGNVDLAGKTARQAEEIIRSRYERDYLVRAQVNLIVMEYVPRNVFVVGSVGQPGVVPFPREQGLTLLDAISRAGSFNRLADKKHVTLKRTYSDGRTETFTINAEDLSKGESTETWPLQPRTSSRSLNECFNPTMSSVEPQPQRTPEPGGYGYNYGGNYAGYSAVGYGYGDGSSGMHRSFQDYVLILRERIWYVIVVFLVIFSSALVYTLSQPKIYSSVATLQVLRSDPKVMQVQQVTDNDIRGTEDLNTQLKVMESGTIIQKVAERITGEDKAAFLAPYDHAVADTAFVAETLAKNRKVQLQRLTLIITVSYEHPDRFVAAKVANLFADEYLAHNTRLRADDAARAFDDLKNTADDQRKKVDQLARRLQEYKEKNNQVSLDQRKDIVSDTLKSLNAEVNRTASLLTNAELRLTQVKEHRAKGADLMDLTFIAAQPLITKLTQDLAARKIMVAQLGERYRDKHPKMVEAARSLEQTQRELSKAISDTCDQVESEYQLALSNSRRAQEDLARQKTESLELDRNGLEYSSLERELKTNELILQSITARARETSMTGNIKTENARIVDRAAPSREDKPISPNLALNLGLGVAGGLGLGLAFAFFVAFIDDRVKSSFDIEGVVGVPLIGIIPQIKRMDPTDKAQMVMTNADRQVSEAFLALHSSLRLKNESKTAKVILTTSTIPGRGSPSRRPTWR